MVKGWMQQLKPILLALGFVLIVRTVFAEPYSVPTPSMVPTLLVGDQLVGTKFAYGYSKYSCRSASCRTSMAACSARRPSAATSWSSACRAIPRRPTSSA